MFLSHKGKLDRFFAFRLFHISEKAFGIKGKNYRLKFKE